MFILRRQLFLEGDHLEHHHSDVRLACHRARPQWRASLSAPNTAEAFCKPNQLFHSVGVIVSPARSPCAIRTIAAMSPEPISKSGPIPRAFSSTFCALNPDRSEMNSPSLVTTRMKASILPALPQRFAPHATNANNHGIQPGFSGHLRPCRQDCRVMSSVRQRPSDQDVDAKFAMILAPLFDSLPENNTQIPNFRSSMPKIRPSVAKR
jgi:hypothetical protein